MRTHPFDKLGDSYGCRAHDQTGSLVSRGQKGPDEKMAFAPTLKGQCFLLNINRKCLPRARAFNIRARYLTTCLPG
jgi:hypothetical protein